MLTIIVHHHSGNDRKQLDIKKKNESKRWKRRDRIIIIYGSQD